MVDTGLFMSEVLSTFDNPTNDFVSVAHSVVVLKAFLRITCNASPPAGTPAPGGPGTLPPPEEANSSATIISYGDNTTSSPASRFDTM
ncbi:hypothetical protein D3C74_287190 [compost metagenome]